MIKYIFFFCIAVYASFASAGSQGGHILLSVPMDSAQEYKSNVDAYFNYFYGIDNELSPSCKTISGMFEGKIKSQVDIFYLKRRPEGVDSQILREALNNKRIAKKLKQIIGNYKDDLIEGFDSILFYEVVNRKINFYGLSAISKKIIFEKSVLSVDDIQNNEKLGLALCQVIAKLPVPEP